MTTMGSIHLTFAFLAIGAGAWVLLTGKGTRWHRTLGHLYALSMVGVVVTSFLLFNLTGGFGPFHFAAIVGGVTVAGGLYSVLARRPRKHWIEAHATWMSWSYVGLMAAFAAESATRFVMPRIAPLLDQSDSWTLFWVAVAVASFGTFFVGSRIVKGRLPASIASVPQIMRRERERLRRLEAVAMNEESSAQS